MRSTQVSAALAFAALPAACVLPPPIFFTGDPAAPTVVVTERGWPISRPPCVTHVRLWHGDADGWKPGWSLEAGRCVRVKRIDYGQAPAGFTQTSTAQPLEIGSLVGVEVVGPGFEARFRVRRDADGFDYAPDAPEFPVAASGRDTRAPLP